MHAMRLNYLEGDKPGDNLAWRLRQEKAAKSIQALRTSSGESTSSRQLILFFKVFELPL